MEFFAAFSTSQAWVELLVLIFLEMVLGIDNLVFIAITTNRLPEEKRHIGRRFGLLGALCMRILLLCTITWIVSHNDPLFVLPVVGTPITVRSLVLIIGGIYLIYKGISELHEKVTLKEELAEVGHPDALAARRVGLPQAIVTIMVMDIVFSLDSVITAVGLVGSLPIMITAVILAVLVMIVFADPISDFINDHADIKILALTFILLVGCILVCSGLSIEIPETTVYFAMFFALAVNLIQMLYARNLRRMVEQANGHRTQPAEREFLAAKALEVAAHEDGVLTETELREMVGEVLGMPADAKRSARPSAQVERDDGGEGR